MTTVDTPPLAWDPLNEKYKVDPHPIWRRLRDEAPLYYNDELDFYAVSRFADVDAFSRDPKTFCSSHGTVLEMLGPERTDMEIMIFMDPPEHTRYRRLVSKAFTPRRMALLEDDIRALCAGLLDGLEGRSSFDYVQDFGARVPAYVIAALLGVPPEDRDMVRGLDRRDVPPRPREGYVQRGLGGGDGQARRVRHRHADRSAECTARRHVHRPPQRRDRRRGRRAAAADHRAVGDLRAPDRERRHRDGGPAPRLGRSGLADNPDQRAELAADAGLIPNAVEELLRYEAPSPVQSRWCTADVELHGQVIPADSKVVMITGSAGRDERAFPDADRFDIHRKMDHHLSFGYGIHFCLGAALARMEGRIALEETLRRFPEWTVDLDGAVPLYTSTVRGYSKLPIVV